MTSKAKMIRRLSEAQNWKCAYCGRPMRLHDHANLRATIEHVRPRSKHGRSEWHNLVAACCKCNRERGNQKCGRFRRRRGKQITPHEREQAAIAIEHLEQRA